MYLKKVYIQQNSCSMTKTIEEQYKKLTQREHVLLRSGMYIGDVGKKVSEQWVYDTPTSKMVKKFVEYSPAFIKIFDEVLTNATDQATRDPTVTTIKVDYDKESGAISVYNNGKGIPVVMHKDHQLYVPELIFGHLLSGSNYDDTDQRTGSGLNGLGVKLVSIHSKKFWVETVDSDSGLKFTQEYSNNMADKTNPKISKTKVKSYTKVSFIPDYERFSMTGLEDDAIALLEKRVVDCMVCTSKSVSIWLNGVKIKGQGMQDYAKLFFDQDHPNKTKVYYENMTTTVKNVEFVWEMVIVPWDEFEHVSFVNGNSTTQGGSHVDLVVNQITKKLKALIETKKKIKEVKPAMIRDKLFLLLRATIVNPMFNSQTKESLTTQVAKYGCKVEVPDKFIEQLWKSSIIQDIVELCKHKESMDLARKTDGTKRNKLFIPKLEDAIFAGTAKSNQCTLILTEGDSAKTFAMWGRSVVGNDKFGVYPLKGKVLNIRDATVQQLINNEEINNLKQIIGLKQDKTYMDTSDLRYGKVMILTDSDVDGSHIKALLVNFFHAQWPSLLKLDFVQTLRTPIIKAIKGKQVIEFFTEQDYQKWKDNKNINTSSFRIRYFKGLGTSQKEDAKDTFTKMNSLKVDYYYKDKQCDEAILLAFDKDKNVARKRAAGSENTGEISCTNKRKEWLKQYDKDSYIEASESKVSYQDLINKELIHFSVYDNTRSIPNMCDGLKPSQRKILYYMLNKNITKSIKVGQLSGYVSAETGYHHGETSLQQAIVGMAQDFVGSNNINLLFPDGNFGTRLTGGKDAASPRYIYTYLSPLSTLVFNQHDMPLLTQQYDDGQVVEPACFVPVIPMVLVNGCEGIGTGYSTYIPPHDPKDVIANIIRIMDGKHVLPMKPYFKGFKGKVEEITPGSFVTRGVWERLDSTRVQITEIPVGAWVTPFKEYLESLIDGVVPTKKDAPSKSKKQFLKDVKNQTVDENSDICFIVEFKDATTLDTMINDGVLDKELRLVKSFTTNNMYMFDDNLIPSRYNSSTDILLDFYDIRLEYYEMRKANMILNLEEQVSIVSSKVRFINGYINGDIHLNRRSNDEVLTMLKSKKFPLHGENKSYDYLTRMPLISLTQEKLEELEKQEREKRAMLAELKNKSAKHLWREDINRIVKIIM